MNNIKVFKVLDTVQNTQISASYFAYRGGILADFSSETNVILYGEKAMQYLYVSSTLAQAQFLTLNKDNESFVQVKASQDGVFSVTQQQK